MGGYDWDDDDRNVKTRAPITNCKITEQAEHISMRDVLRSIAKLSSNSDDSSSALEKILCSEFKTDESWNNFDNKEYCKMSRKQSESTLVLLDSEYIACEGEEQSINEQEHEQDLVKETDISDKNTQELPHTQIIPSETKFLYT